MGKLLSSYRNSLYDSLISEIRAGTATYYAFAANPVLNNGIAANSVNNSYDNIFKSNWLLMFGKKITNNDVLPVVKNIPWASNTVYTRYDDTANNQANSHAVVHSGGYYHVYRCIDNGNGANSTQTPDLQQATTFAKSDGYMWRYLYSLSDATYNAFATTDYIPVQANATIQGSAANNRTVDVLVVANAGVGYIATHENVVRSYVNSTVVQIGSSASDDNNFYTNNAIYIYNVGSPTTSQLRVVSSYVVNSLGKWVFLNSAANTQNITPDLTKYLITPQVKFDTDGTTDPIAYAAVNSSAQVNNVVVLDGGAGITRASAIIISNTVYGSGANVYCIVPPPGGHGSNPTTELDCQGIAFSFSFANSESNSIPTNVKYNRIGLYKNPYIMQANLAKGAAYTNATFNQILVANVSPSFTFSYGVEVVGSTSGARGIVAFSNSTQVYIVGDKAFSNNETITELGTANSTSIVINSKGNIYTPDLYPLYTQNIEDVTRSGTQTESYKVIIKVAQ